MKTILVDAVNTTIIKDGSGTFVQFKELFDLANGMFDRIIEGRSCAKAVKDFDARKKARGIE
jgi:hypothetical protein